MSEPEWEFVSKSVVHRGYLTLAEHKVRLPTGESIRYEVDESVPFNVAVLGLTGEGHLRLARQYRYPIRRWIYDLPGGGAEPGESPIDAASREYEEETGLRPLSLSHLFTFFQNPARMAYPVHLYFCTGTGRGTPVTDDPQEVVRAVTMPVDEFDRLVSTGEIIDPPLLIARMIAAQRGLLPPVSRS